MTFGKTATWFDALPPLSECSIPPFKNASYISWSSQIASAREAGRAGREGSRHALAQTLLVAYKSGMGSECLSESLAMLRGLHESASSDERKRTTMDLGEALFAEHERTGTLEPVQEMVRIYEQASSELEDTLGLDMRCQLAKALIARGAFTGEDADVFRAKAIMDAVELALDPSPSSQAQFTIVSAMYQLTIGRAYQKYTLQDLQHLAEDLHKHLRNPLHPGSRTDLLAACFSVWAIIYPLTTSVDCPSSVVDMAESALDGLVGEHFAVLSALTGFCLNLDVHRNKKPRYMPKVRQLVERMFRAAEDNPISTSYAHHALGNWMIHSYHWSTTDYKDSLDVAAVQYRQALSLCPPGHIYRHGYLVGLSCSLINLYSETGARSALNEVVALYDNYADIARRVPPFACNIADAVVARVQAGRLRLESKRILARRATQLLRDLLLVTSEANAYYPVLLRRLSGVYFLEISWGSADQSEHLAFARRSVAVGMSTESDVAQLETRLAKVLIIIAQRNSDTTALHEAMSLLERIAKRPVQDFVDYHSSEISWLRARGYMIRYKLLSDDKDLDAAEELFRALCRDPSGCLVGRLNDAFSWADTARYANDEAMEMRAYQHMISTLPQLAYLGENVATRVEALYLAEGLSCRAASLALTLNDVCDAIEVLEQSRGVVWAQSLRPKAVMDAIPSQYLEAFKGAAYAVEKATDPAERRRHAAQLEALSRQIRQVEGYERFLLTRGYPELKASASFGFIVLVVPSDAFTDVIIIRDVESPPGHLRLPVLKLARLQELAATLKKISDRSRDSAINGPRGMKMVKAGRAQLSSDVEAAYMNALGQLWTELVYPVVADLRLQHSSNRPRLWWCPTGALAELPLHAAGIYKGLDRDCLSNYAVSSYTPTISALVDAQAKKTNPNDCSSSQVLVVSLSEVSGLSPLPNARIETDLIRKRIPLVELKTLSDHQASVANVLETLPSTSILHLACHGHQSQDDPLTSGFSLDDGRLTLERLMRLQLPHAELAYLSACETASTDEYQPDEVINLAATMLFAGFKSVIATMWSMNDLDGPFIAERVYRSIFQEGKLDLDAVPYALDAAVRELRESGVHPSRWATYVHIGA